MGQLSPIGIFGGSILGAAAFALGATPLSFIIGLFGIIACRKFNIPVF
ncbi:hypothetical protein [Acidiplasma cupricumulans]|nr:hypothetical protein [Acidiplasma cupricumulans]